MSQPLTWKSGDLRAALAHASAVARHVGVREAWFTFGWRWLTGAAGFLLLDLVFQLPVPLRWVGLVGLIGYPIWTARQIRQGAADSPYPEEHSARLVEEGHPELNNALINAVQFGRVVGGAPESQAELMRREISRAEAAVAVTSIDDVVSREGEQCARRFMFAAIGIWIAASVLAPGVVFTILPRMFAPWLDDITPPFSFTKIEISPKGALVRYGGTLVVQVAVRGPIPDDLSLTTRAGNKATESPLESTEPGKYTISLSGLKANTWIVAHGGNARSARYLVKIVLPPVANSLLASYSYPAYMNRKPVVEQVGEQGIHGFRQTKVHLQIAANRPLTGGDFVIESPNAPSQHVSLKVEGQQALGDFTLSTSGTFHVALAGDDAQVNADAAHGKIVIDPDLRPNVWFDEPPQQILVTPSMKIDLSVGAEDENGIARVGLHRIINGIADSEKPLYTGAPITRTGARLTMDMADLGVRPGDELTYYADAFDAAPGKPNYGQTEPYTIKVVSDAEFKKNLQDERDADQIAREIKDIRDALDSLAQRQQDLADKMDRLAKAMEKKPGDPELAKQMAAAKAEQKQLQKDAEQTAQKLRDYAASPSASPLEQTLKKKVGEAAQGLAQAAKAMAGAQSQDPGAAAAAAKKAAQALAKTASQTQKTAGQAAQNLEKAAPLFHDVNRFMDLLNRQGQLVLESRQFELPHPVDNVDRSRMAAIGSEEQKIKDELRALQDDFRRHAADAKAAFPKAADSAVRIANEIGNRAIPDIMNSSETNFGQEQGPLGFSSAKKAFDQMNAMVSECKSGQGTCKGELDIALSRSLGSSGLGQSMGNGMKPGQGTNAGEGSGGSMSDANGATASGTSSRVAYTMSLRTLPSGGGSDPKHAAQHAPGDPADLAPDRVEKLGDDRTTPSKASDASTKGYPPEYRKLIRDYFMSVSKEQK